MSPRLVTQQIHNHLTSLIDCLYPLDNQLSDDNKVFILSVHDWLCHLVERPRKWPLYDTNLNHVITTKTPLVTPVIRHWMNEINNPLSIKTLLYRHYLVKHVVEQEIFVTPNFVPFYLLIASMLTSHPVFHCLPQKEPWNQLLGPYPLINQLRKARPVLQQQCYQLTMREEEIDNDLMVDHGLLSSLSLLYGLYLTCVIVSHERTVRPTLYLDQVYQTLVEVLIHLQGVLIHVED